MSVIRHHGLDKDLTFRVQQTAFGEHGETLRAISLNGNIEIARAAFQAAVRCYPNERLMVGRLHRREV